MFRLFIILIPLTFITCRTKETIHILEDLPIGTSIYTFNTEGCQTVNSTGTYRFVDSQKNSNDFFLIDPYTGRVTTKKLIDRDDFCLRRSCSCAKCEITLEVLCVNMGQIYFNDLAIIIDDRNDHAPQFPKSSLTIDVLENVPIGYLIPLDVAIDPDYGLNSIQGYQLIEENSTSTSKINRIINAFQIEYSKKNDLLALRLIKTLDREICDSLHYVLQAYDGGQPQALVGRLNIRIQILDVNDMSPVFDRADIRVLLSESTSIGSLVARVHAFDADTGLNGLVYYTIVSLDPPSNGTFQLSKETGEIRLGKSLDYEKEKFYRLKIKAQDNGPQQGSIPAFATVDIDIKDENDNYPLITTSFNDDSNAGVYHVMNTTLIRVRENTANNTFLGHISINDLDQNDNGRVSWSLESNGSIAIKELLNNEAFLMFTQQIFDREEQSIYEISLQAHDHGTPPLESTLNFTLVILDENDNAPKFDENFYSLNISETIPVDTLLLHFHAVDYDEENTPNSQIEYLFLNQTNQTQFFLNSSTGQLFLISPLDREEISTYHFDLMATDHGYPQALSSIVHCVITVLDMNDNYPVFDVSEYQFEIAETWPILAPIGRIQATDADEYYSELSYTLVTDELTMSDQWPFGLTTNGTLYLQRTSVGIDYERQAIYKFAVVASDNGGLNSTIPVTVFIRNRNDFCPELKRNSTALFFNADLWNTSNTDVNEYRLNVYDGDNDTCLMELLNFRDIFHLEEIERNQYVLSALMLPEREFYILQFRLRDLVDENDQPCLRTFQLVLTLGTNETNQTLALETAREYLEALHLTSKRSHSYFDLTLLNVILLFVLLSIAIIIALVAIKLVFLSSSSSSSSSSGSSSSSLRHRRQRQQRKLRLNGNTSTTAGTLYRLQGPTETQLPLLDHGPADHSLTSSLIVSNGKMLPSNEQQINHSMEDDAPAPLMINDPNADENEQKQALLHHYKTNNHEFKTFAVKSANNAYDIIGDILHSGDDPSPIYNRIRDSGYETTSSSIDHQQHCLDQSSPSNVSLSADGQVMTVTYFSSLSSTSIPMHHDLSLSTSNTLSRTLTTFSPIPVINESSTSSSGMINARLAEQEIIEV